MDEDTFRKRLTALGLAFEDIEESFSRSSGPGGQNVNKVSTSVTLRHRMTGAMVTVQDTRSQHMNRELARERLLDAIVTARQSARAERVEMREKQRRQNRPRPRRLKERILEGKRRRAKVKKLRGGAGE